MSAQIPLKLEHSLRYSSTGFVVHAGVVGVIDAVLNLSRRGIFSLLYLHGAQATGKTHLGVYIVGTVRTEARFARLIPAGQLAAWFKEQLPREPLLPNELVILDDADQQLESAREKMEIGLFEELVERVSEVAGTLVLMGCKRFETLQCSPQAKSRLAAGVVVSVGDPEEGVLDTILDSIAKQRGLALSEAKRTFLLRRVVRNIPGLVECVGRVEEGAVESSGASTSFEVLSEAVTAGRSRP